MRMFTEVGRRVLPHSTGVGKALLANTPADEVRALLARTGMPAATEKTITTPDGFLTALEEVRRLGYAVDDNEQEIGVRCPRRLGPDCPPAAAISISGPAGRVTDVATERSCPCSSRSRRSCRRRWPARARGPDRAPGGTRGRSRRSPARPGAGPGVRGVRRPGRAP